MFKSDLYWEFFYPEKFNLCETDGYVRDGSSPLWKYQRGGDPHCAFVGTIPGSCVKLDGDTFDMSSVELGSSVW